MALILNVIIIYLLRQRLAARWGLDSAELMAIPALLATAALGISDAQGRVKPSRQAKYRQVEELLRDLAPVVDDAVATGRLGRQVRVDDVQARHLRERGRKLIRDTGREILLRRVCLRRSQVYHRNCVRLACACRASLCLL